MSKKSDRSANNAALKTCRILYACWSGRLVDVVALVAKEMGVNIPGTKKARYALLRSFVAGRVGVADDKTAWRLARAAKSQQFHTSRTSHAAVNSDAFLSSYEWRALRMLVLKKYGARCQCCGASPADGVRIHVDHIKPRRLFPELALEESNLQVLCEVCNHGKGNWDQTDWRPSEEPQADDPSVMPMWYRPGVKH